MPSQNKPTEDLIRALPKVLLHEHLDGGLRPSTVLELAREAGYDGLPESDPEALGRWFFEGAARGSLPRYLEGFSHTIAVMQSAEALERVELLTKDMRRRRVRFSRVRQPGKAKRQRPLKRRGHHEQCASRPRSKRIG